MENKQTSKKSVTIGRMYPDDYFMVEHQPLLKRIEVTIAYGLLDGLCDSIILYYNGKIGYKPLFCTLDLDIDGIKKVWE